MVWDAGLELILLLSGSEMGKKSKPKGNANEREIAKILSDWSGEQWHRIPNSGALRWGDGTWTYGDLLPPESWAIVVECKHYADVSVDALLGEKKLPPEQAMIAKWWYEQTCDDAERCRRECNLVHVEPLLVFKKDYGRFRCAIRHDFYRGLGLDISKLVCSIPGHETFVLLDFVRFLEKVSPGQFPRAYKVS